MDWRAREADDVLAHSDELIAPESVLVIGSFWKGLTMLPSLARVRYIPGKKTLADVLPSQLYERWIVLRKRFLPKDEAVERLRPVFAAQRLYDAALDRLDLTDSPPTWAILLKLAKNHHVRPVTPSDTFRIQNPRDLIREFGDGPVESELKYLSATLDRIEMNLDTLAARANAWAVGDIDALRRLKPVSQAESCLDALTGAPALRAEAEQHKSNARALWLAEVNSALARNSASFAALPIDELLSHSGHVAELLQRGYQLYPPAMSQ